MHYCDTSFVIPLIMSEKTSEAVGKAILKLPTESLAISNWTRVEFSSMVARHVRMGKLKPVAAREATLQFESEVVGSFKVWPPQINDFDLATKFLERFETGLKAGDALHLAIAHNRGATVVYSLDRKLIKAARILGIPASSGISSRKFGIDE